MVPSRLPGATRPSAGVQANFGDDDAADEMVRAPSNDAELSLYSTVTHPVVMVSVPADSEDENLGTACLRLINARVARSSNWPAVTAYSERTRQSVRTVNRARLSLAVTTAAGSATGSKACGSTARATAAASTIAPTMRSMAHGPSLETRPGDAKSACRCLRRKTRRCSSRPGRARPVRRLPRWWWCRYPCPVPAWWCCVRPHCPVLAFVGRVSRESQSGNALPRNAGGTCSHSTGPPLGLRAVEGLPAPAPS